MALWREWTAGIQAGVTTVTINHYMDQAGFLIMSTAIRMSAQVRIGHEGSDFTDLDGYLSQAWCDGISFQIRENLRLASETPNYGVAAVRNATTLLLGPENTPRQII